MRASGEAIIFFITFFLYIMLYGKEQFFNSM